MRLFFNWLLTAVGNTPGCQGTRIKEKKTALTWKGLDGDVLSNINLDWEKAKKETVLKF